MKRLLRNLMLPISLLGIMGVFAFSGGAYAQSLFGDVCDGSTTDATVCKEVVDSSNDTTKDNAVLGPDGVMTNAINLLSIVVGVVSVIMIIIGGLKYVLSEGDSAKAVSARSTLLYAIVGVVIAASSQAIIVFVINKI